MDLIVAVDKNWGIGRQEDLLFRISEDMKRFRALTIGKTVILGRKTLQTFPGGRPLQKRTNIVMTRSDTFEAEPAIICHSLTQLREQLRDLPEDDVFVIGGASLYQQLLPFCRQAFVTKIDHSAAADTFFPNLDHMPEWELTGCEAGENGIGMIIGEAEPTPIRYTFCVYRQKMPRSLFDES